jgi:hypothetical protein
MTRTTGQATEGVMMTAAVVAATLFSGAKAFAGLGEQMTVVLHVSDYAHLSPSDLNGAEDEATRIYRTADIKMVWVNPDAAAGEEYAAALHLNVLLLNREMAQHKIDVGHIGPNVLGSATHAAARGYIFCHRIAADAYSLDFRTALGRALAHEVGHLVLPVYSHSGFGIMRAVVDLYGTPPQFSREQVTTIHETIAADLRAKR